jgi:hypothetical protein
MKSGGSTTSVSSLDKIQARTHTSRENETRSITAVPHPVVTFVMFIWSARKMSSPTHSNPKSCFFRCYCSYRYLILLHGEGPASPVVRIQDRTVQAFIGHFSSAVASWQRGTFAQNIIGCTYHSAGGSFRHVDGRYEPGWSHLLSRLPITALTALTLARCYCGGTADSISLRYFKVFGLFSVDP